MQAGPFVDNDSPRVLVVGDEHTVGHRLSVLRLLELLPALVTMCAPDPMPEPREDLRELLNRATLKSYEYVQRRRKWCGRCRDTGDIGNGRACPSCQGRR